MGSLVFTSWVFLFQFFSVSSLIGESVSSEDAIRAAAFMFPSLIFMLTALALTSLSLSFLMGLVGTEINFSVLYALM